MSVTAVREVPAGGLSSLEAARLLRERGPNRPPAARPRRWYRRVWSQLRDPMILLLLAAGVLTAVLHEEQNTVLIAAVVVFNTLTGVVQETRADRAVAAIGALTPAVARVLRDGDWRDIGADEVVPGDAVALAAGDLVPADGRLTTAVEVEVDESSLTGESMPVPKSVADELTGGTLLTRGRGRMVVERTGPDSGVGRLALLVAAAPVRATPLQRRLSRLSRQLVLTVAVLTVVVMALGLAQGRSLQDVSILGVSLAVAAVPESLPAVVAIALALGARRMARRNAVVRRLPAVETLGSVTVIATDKTGTLTQGRMVAERVWTAPGDGDEARDRLLRDVVLCNDAEPARPGAPATGDPLELALLTLAAGEGVDVLGSRKAWRRTGEAPFDAVRRMMTTHHRREDGTRLTVHKGAPEAVADLVRSAPAAAVLRDAAAELADAGYRVLAVAEETDGSTTAVGLVGIADPPREHAREAVARCLGAGIRVIVVTGDHLGTARAIAEQVGITAADGERSVFARVRPEQKVEIVRGLQDAGEVVAMLGDGVNDAPALRTADIGVAAGRGGTEAARQAADLVLLDDDLATVVAAVEEGRRIVANIRSFLVYAVSGGLAEVAVMIGGPALGIALPLLPAQILWINLLTHGLTGAAFGAEPADPADMSRPPRPPEEAVLSRWQTVQLAVAGAALTAVALVCGVLAPAGEVQTALFLSLGAGQLGVAWAIRARPAHRELRSRGLELAVLVAVTAMVLATAAGPLQHLLGTRALGATGTLLALAAAVVPGGVLRLLTVRHERRGHHERQGPRGQRRASR